eukprot:COSAG06_NODE_16544_length_995_cov_1.001116_1_plen_31_part_10
MAGVGWGVRVFLEIVGVTSYVSCVSCAHTGP